MWSFGLLLKNFEKPQQFLLQELSFKVLACMDLINATVPGAVSSLDFVGLVGVTRMTANIISSAPQDAVRMLYERVVFGQFLIKFMPCNFMRANPTRPRQKSTKQTVSWFPES
jgi:hypothetical protein